MFNIPKHQLNFCRLNYIKINDLKKLARWKDEKCHQNVVKIFISRI